MPRRSASLLFPPDLPTGIDIPSEKVIKELEHVNLPPLADSFDDILSKSNVKFRNTIEVDPRSIRDVPRPYSGLRHRAGRSLFCALTYGNSGGRKDLPSILFEQQAVVIGGAIVRHVSLVVSEGPNDSTRFGNLPVQPLQIPEGQKSKLFSKEPEGDEAQASMLLFPEPYITPPGFENFDLFGEEGDGNVIMSGPLTGTRTSRSDLEDSMTKAGMKMANLELYTVSGDIVDFWGVKELTARLYKYKG